MADVNEGPQVWHKSGYCFWFDTPELAQRSAAMLKVGSIIQVLVSEVGRQDELADQD